MLSEKKTTPVEAVSEPEGLWLNPLQLRAWITFWGVTHVVDATLDGDLRASSGLSHNDYQLLVLLSNVPEHRLRMSELADINFESRSRLTYQIKQLEHDGLVQREDCITDKRGAMAVLTPKGQELLRVTAPSYTASIRRIFFDRLTYEQTVILGDALQNIFKGLRDAAPLDGVIEREIKRGEAEPQ